MGLLSKKTGLYRTHSVKVFCFNTEDLNNIENEVNRWLQEYDDHFDVVDIKLSECQNKTVILIHYKKKEAN